MEEIQFSYDYSRMGDTMDIILLHRFMHNTDSPVMNDIGERSLESSSLNNSLTVAVERSLNEQIKENPVPNNVFNKLITIKMDKGLINKHETCVICTENFSLYEDVLNLPCNHLYHKFCIIEWFKRKNTCPICRHKISEVINSESEEDYDDDDSDDDSDSNFHYPSNFERYDDSDSLSDLNLQDPVVNRLFSEALFPETLPSSSHFENVFDSNSNSDSENFPDLNLSNNNENLHNLQVSNTNPTNMFAYNLSDLSDSSESFSDINLSGTGQLSNLDPLNSERLPNSNSLYFSESMDTLEFGWLWDVNMDSDLENESIL